MVNINAFSGVAAVVAAGMWTLHAVTAPAHAAAAAPQRKRRTAAATAASVNRGTA